MKRRAQAAMEFLMTYGWAILVVLVVIGALAYFGVLDPTTLLPPKCNFPAGFYCTDHLVRGTEISFLLQNGLGRDINIANIVANETSASSLHECSLQDSDKGQLSNGASRTFILNAGAKCVGTSISVGRKYKYDLIVTYNFTGSTAFMHTMDGELFSKVES